MAVFDHTNSSPDKEGPRISEQDCLLYMMDTLLELEDIAVAADQQALAESLSAAAISAKLALRRLQKKDEGLSDDS